MSQFSWTLLDDFGKRYEIGLYHGDRSKYVLIYVNKKPIVVDFSIKETKKYSFYIGHELCDMKIEKKPTNSIIALLLIKMWTRRSISLANGGVESILSFLLS